MKGRKTTINGVDFPTLFNAGCYSGLACCMFAIAANALFTSVRRRGTTRQLSGAIMICVIAALLLLLALVWYNLRFSPQQGQIPAAEVELALVYVALWGWGLPLGVTATYSLFTLPRDTTTALHIPLQKSDSAPKLAIPRFQQGVASPYIFNEETPWGWLQYHHGNFQGQRLALKRQIATLGRDENCDIWIDDDMASRHHAELVYHQGKVYLTDCDSLNGTLLNEKRMRGTMQVEAGNLLQIGEQCFSFILADAQLAMAEHSDPLAHHLWRSSLDSLTGRSEVLPRTPSSEQEFPTQVYSDETAEIDYRMPQSPPMNPGGAIIIRSGVLAEQSFVLDRAVISVGRGLESDIVIDDTSISRRHVQFLRQPDGDYVQDLGSRNGTQVNGELLRTLQILLMGDMIVMGNIRLEYAKFPTARTIPTSRATAPRSLSGLVNGPTLLKLPSKRK